MQDREGVASLYATARRRRGTEAAAGVRAGVDAGAGAGAARGGSSHLKETMDMKMHAGGTDGRFGTEADTDADVSLPEGRGSKPSTAELHLSQ